MSDEKKVIEEQNTEEKGFWTKNIISILLIVFLIVSGVYAFNRDSSKNEKSVEEKVEEIKKEETEEVKNTDEESLTNEEAKEQKSDIQRVESKIIVKANAGDGVTQLARKAISEYSKDKEISLSKEQKLYAETNLKNEYYQHHLSIGQEVSFEEKSLDETIQKAQNLSEKEIKSWSKYVHLVPSL